MVFLLQSAGLGLQLRVYRGVPLVSLNAITPDKKVEVRPQVRFSFRVALLQVAGTRSVGTVEMIYLHTQPHTRYICLIQGILFFTQ